MISEMRCQDYTGKMVKIKAIVFSLTGWIKKRMLVNVVNSEVDEGR